MGLTFKRFRQIFENAPLGIFLTTREGYFIDLNKRLTEILGYDSVQDIKDHIKNLGTDLYLNEDDRKNIIALIDAGNGIIIEELRYKKKDGQVIDVRLSISSFSENKNGSPNFIGMVEDISEKKALEKQLQDRENLLTSIVNCLPFELWVIDRQGEVLSQSGYSQKKWGNYVSKNIQSFSQREFSRLNDEIHRVWDGEHIDMEEEADFEGKTLYTRKILTPLFSGEEIKGTIVISLNQTEKVIAQKRVLEIQQFLETVINGIPVRLFWNNQNQKFVGANSAFLKDFKLASQEALIGKTNIDLFPGKNANAYTKIFNKVIKKKTPIINHKMWLDIPGQKRLYIIASFIPYFSKSDNQVEGIFGCYQDITLMKTMEEELQVHRKELEKLVEIRTWELDQINEELLRSNGTLMALNETLSQQKTELSETLDQLKTTQDNLIQSEKMASLGILSAGIAHEVNNPLNFISSGTQGIALMMQEMDTLYLEIAQVPEAQKAEKLQMLTNLFSDMKQMFGSINKGVERTAEIVKGLRVFSRMDHEEKSPADVHELIELALTILKNKYKNHVTIVRNFEALPNIKCFPGKLSQVFLNLLMNAIQAIKENGLVEISTHLNEEEKQIKIKIADNGHGIPAKIRNKIFDPFFTTKTVNEGTGMGLSIVHSIIEMHKGTIDFESIIKKGTIFRISIPIE
jgi:PAS domain S-box-containing protein